MSALIESTVEDVALKWLGNLEYPVLRGEEVA
jgi:hypothetical protein